MGAFGETYRFAVKSGEQSHDLRVEKRERLSGKQFGLKVFDGEELIHERTVDYADDIYEVQQVEVPLGNRKITLDLGYAKPLKSGLVVKDAETEIFRSFEGDFSDGGKFGDMLRSSEETEDDEPDNPLEDETRALRDWVVGLVIALIVFGGLYYFGMNTTLVKAYLLKKLGIGLLIVLGTILFFAGTLLFSSLSAKFKI